MFGSNVLEVAFGLVLVYSLMSLLCSTINEQVIARLLALRAQTLEDGIKTILEDPQGTGIVQKFYQHPLIKGLATQSATDKLLRRAGRPSYISARTFALVVKDITTPAKNVATPATIKDIETSAKDMQTLSTIDLRLLPPALAHVVEQAQGDVQKEIANIEAWYNEVMDRVSGWYKRKVQLIIFVLAFLIAVSLNVDTIAILTNLSTSTSIRSAIVSAAQGSATTQASNNLTTLQKSIDSIQPVIGWLHTSFPTDVWGWLSKIAGLLATTFAISLGAPFWFDVLSKVALLRSSGPPPSTNAPGVSIVTTPGDGSGGSSNVTQ